MVVAHHLSGLLALHVLISIKGMILHEVDPTTEMSNDRDFEGSSWQIRGLWKHLLH